jgi:benzoate/toluate 1,2-dioxygenase beta subunit
MSLPLDPAAERAAERFVLTEARLLDERRFDQWLALFAPDGLYWVPSEPGQVSPADTLSLFCERRPLLAVRVQRMSHPNHFAQVPMSRTHHQVSGIVVDASEIEGVDLVVHASLIMAEWREGEARWFAGRSTHHLVSRSSAAAGEPAFEIALKRVDLINCDAPHRFLAVPF